MEERMTVTGGSSPIENEIFALETAIGEQVQKLANLKRSLPPIEVADDTLYSLTGPVKLSQLFGTHKNLLVIHNMGVSCSYCTLWADTINGFLPHLESTASVVLCTPDTPEVQRTFALSRSWKFRMVRDGEMAFTKSSGFLAEDDSCMPGYSTYCIDSTGKILRMTRAGFGPGDLYCGLWHMIPTLTSQDWYPRFSYV
jgi:predicted dithiol-disulfide oxidoreductase (DUF899 family)